MQTGNRREEQQQFCKKKIWNFSCQALVAHRGQLFQLACDGLSPKCRDAVAEMVSAKARGPRGRSVGKADDCWHQLCGPRTAGQAGTVDQAWVSGAGPETEGLAVSDEPLRILGSTSVETSCLVSFFWLTRPSGEGKFLRFLTDRFRQKKNAW